MPPFGPSAIPAGGALRLAGIANQLPSIPGLATVAAVAIDQQLLLQHLAT
jgi:hypothetical protein